MPHLQFLINHKKTVILKRIRLGMDKLCWHFYSILKENYAAVAISFEKDYL